ncbi:hypothetical protein H6504_05560 [Candidatus Woesearchaeota archaeon]|nr:hypothetical protein [Candidatus Woesearchaeota archaeon]
MKYSGIVQKGALEVLVEEQAKQDLQDRYAVKSLIKNAGILLGVPTALAALGGLADGPQGVREALEQISLSILPYNATAIAGLHWLETRPATRTLNALVVKYRSLIPERLNKLEQGEYSTPTFLMDFALGTSVYYAVANLAEYATGIDFADLFIGFIGGATMVARTQSDIATTRRWQNRLEAIPLTRPDAVKTKFGDFMTSERLESMTNRLLLEADTNRLHEQHVYDKLGVYPNVLAYADIDSEGLFPVFRFAIEPGEANLVKLARLAERIAPDSTVYPVYSPIDLDVMLSSPITALTAAEFQGIRGDDHIFTINFQRAADSDRFEINMFDISSLSVVIEAYELLTGHRLRESDFDEHMQKKRTRFVYPLAKHRSEDYYYNEPEVFDPVTIPPDMMQIAAAYYQATCFDKSGFYTFSIPPITYQVQSSAHKPGILEFHQTRKAKKLGQKYADTYAIANLPISKDNILGIVNFLYMDMVPTVEFKTMGLSSEGLEGLVDGTSLSEVLTQVTINNVSMGYVQIDLSPEYMTVKSPDKIGPMRSDDFWQLYQSANVRVHQSGGYPFNTLPWATAMIGRISKAIELSRY